MSPLQQPAALEIPLLVFLHLMWMIQAFRGVLHVRGGGVLTPNRRVLTRLPKRLAPLAKEPFCACVRKMRFSVCACAIGGLLLVTICPTECWRYAQSPTNVGTPSSGVNHIRGLEKYIAPLHPPLPLFAQLPALALTICTFACHIFAPRSCCSHFCAGSV